MQRTQVAVIIRICQEAGLAIVSPLDDVLRDSSQPDARNKTSTYTYDALNRLTAIAYPTPSLNVIYAYDQPNAATGCTMSYPTGRLTKMTDGSGSTTWCYDRRANVTTKKQVTNAVTFTTAYTYTAADRLASMTYPSGFVATYTRDSVGRISTVLWGSSIGTPMTLVSATGYYPFGPLNTLTFGNGRVLTKTYDQDYKKSECANSMRCVQFKSRWRAELCTLKSHDLI